MTRSNAREIACHLVFEMNFNDITAGEALRTLMEESYYPTLKGETDVYEERPDGKQLEYLTNVVQGVQAKPGGTRGLYHEIFRRLEPQPHRQNGRRHYGGLHVRGAVYRRCAHQRRHQRGGRTDAQI